MGTLSACRLLQYLCAIVIVLMIVLLVVTIIVFLSGPSSSPNTGTTANSGKRSLTGAKVLGAGIYLGLHIAVIAVFWKIYKDCADRQDVLVSHHLRTDAKHLGEDLDARLTKPPEQGPAVNEDTATSTGDNTNSPTVRLP